MKIKLDHEMEMNQRTFRPLATFSLWRTMAGSLCVLVTTVRGCVPQIHLEAFTPRAPDVTVMEPCHGPQCAADPDSEWLSSE